MEMSQGQRFVLNSCNGVTNFVNKDNYNTSIYIYLD